MSFLLRITTPPPRNTAPIHPNQNVFSQPWSGWFRKLHDVVASGGAAATPSSTVAKLPTAASAQAGARLFVSDATVTTFATIVVGGGANAVPVYSDGTNWRIG